MDFVHVTAGDDDNGRRLDKIIRRYLNEDSLSRLYSALRKGLIKVDGKKQAPDFRVSAGSDIAIAGILVSKSEPQKERTDSGHRTIDESIVLFRNDDLLVLNKPYDISVQKARADDISLANMVSEDFNARHKDSGSLSFRCGPLHRLDRKTTGIIVFSQSLKGAQFFTNALQSHTVRKMYLALLEGRLESTQTWENRIQKDTSSGQFYRVTASVQPSGKAAETNACSIAPPLACGTYRGRPVTLAQVEIKTGKKHQIRAQAAAHNHPLLGDTAYGGMAISEAQDFYLHAHRLVFGENPHGIPREILADISTNFAKMLSKCLIKIDSIL